MVNQSKEQKLVQCEYTLEKTNGAVKNVKIQVEIKQ
jgi:hypothetical protein